MTFNKLTAAVLFALTSQAANASGFALIEQSASGQGLSYAGAAANAEDASVMWFNPAGLTEIEGSQAIIGAHLIVPKTEYNDTGSIPQNGDTNVDAGVNGFVPNLYWKGQFGEYAVGIGLNAPFGSKVEYDSNWIGRVQAIDTDLKTYNLNTNIARKLSDKVSIGFGLNVQKVDLNMTLATGMGAGSPLAIVKADSIGFGYNLGLLSKVTDNTQIGISYRSEIKHEATGSMEVVGHSITGVKSDVTLPASAMLSISHKMNDNVQFLADATWTGWGAYDQLVITNDAGSLVSATNQKFSDSLRYSAGMIYKLNEKLKLRTGVAIDYTPVPDAEHRSPRTPDSDKTWISAGFNYKLKNNLGLDMAYSHILGGSADINRTDHTLLKGYYDTSVDIFSAQLVWKY
ncbi:fatty acid transporter [Thiomicrorhabdus immobilis]|uniref:Fatty acid transporter n=1 Tax=Thiomicrorhabdus immobilis TaxID=2791037 RepID=A0ABM7MBR5_9GAMM|nr:OmpP1/FadL family transporter [Thiomicrorhabdus immobilis]BCN92811.1 fatty acid transporter [Thiomicrorhabdus immobilis]